MDAMAPVADIDRRDRPSLLVSHRARRRQRVVAALGPMGIPLGKADPEGGADIEAIIAKQKLAMISLSQDGTHYFDLHHTPDDTLDKIDPAMLTQNVDAYAAVLGVVANEAGVIVPLE